jgi:hypothetical protein
VINFKILQNEQGKRKMTAEMKRVQSKTNSGLLLTNKE